ncbi:hypothetical protein GSI_12636 [Ganoderma sinense ZZ0214-1]|uniref:Uncharacterized protein n=1 Tax=Ganoderma sinense ZZ0214-1 TaxID=1077348 RepID=A0A2G8RTC7_9APHY|nr:hypothetical protein GSI_12636 [Ganoderma sinense ZZ0214-1]
MMGSRTASDNEAVEVEGVETGVGRSRPPPEVWKVNLKRSLTLPLRSQYESSRWYAPIGISSSSGKYLLCAFFSSTSFAAASASASNSKRHAMAYTLSGLCLARARSFLLVILTASAIWYFNAASKMERNSWIVPKAGSSTG